MKKKLLKFVGLVLVTIGAVYYLPELFANVFLVGLLVAYFQSKDEALWLAFFITTADGFFGFFGPFEVALTILPGLPEVELVQLYILLSVVKAWQAPAPERIFYSLPLSLLGIYLLFLIVQGEVIGLAPELNVQFRIFKQCVPFLAFYSLPRLIRTREDFRDVIAYLFVVAFMAFVAQVFTIFYLQSPSAFFGAKTRFVLFDVKVNESHAYRGFYNPSILLIAQFGAIYYASQKRPAIPAMVCFLVLASNFLAAFLSASRGWVICFSSTLLFFMFFGSGIQPKQALRLIVASVLLVGLVLTQPIFYTQINNSVERLMTLKALEEGDLTAGGTLSRISERGPRVMKVWRDSPLTGWGFSDVFFRYNDGHVGNQNMLMHSGIIGYALVLFFFFYFCSKLLGVSMMLPPGHAERTPLLMFCFFLMSWYFLHSASAQQFAYHGNPGMILVQVLFFSLGARAYREGMKALKRRVDQTDAAAAPKALQES